MRNKLDKTTGSSENSLYKKLRKSFAVLLSVLTASVTVDLVKAGVENIPDSQDNKKLVCALSPEDLVVIEGSRDSFRQVVDIGEDTSGEPNPESRSRPNLPSGSNYVESELTGHQIGNGFSTYSGGQTVTGGSVDIYSGDAFDWNLFLEVSEEHAGYDNHALVALGVYGEYFLPDASGEWIEVNDFTETIPPLATENAAGEYVYDVLPGFEWPACGEFEFDCISLCINGEWVLISNVDFVTVYAHDGSEPTPEPTSEPTPEPTAEPTPEETTTPYPTPEETTTPYPTYTVTATPTRTPTYTATATPSPTPDLPDNVTEMLGIPPNLIFGEDRNVEAQIDDETPSPENHLPEGWYLEWGAEGGGFNIIEDPEHPGDTRYRVFEPTGALYTWVTIQLYDDQHQAVGDSYWEGFDIIGT